MTDRRMVISKLVYELEHATVGTFDPIWKSFCSVIKEDDPKNFEKYIDKYGKKDDHCLWNQKKYGFFTH